jgi:hypothetical protein
LNQLSFDVARVSERWTDQRTLLTLSDKVTRWTANLLHVEQRVFEQQSRKLSQSLRPHRSQTELLRHQHLEEVE